MKLGHNALSEKFTKKIQSEMMYAELQGAGITKFLEKDLVDKVKYRVKGGHIADTDFDDYTKVIPKVILTKKKKLDKAKVFTDYVVYHYWNEELEAKRESKEKISPSEKSAMKDPILFGTRKDSPGKLFFIGDWDDDECDLSFDDLVDKLALDEEDTKIPLLTKWFGNE